MLTLSISHIDTCLACYVTDHHNRDGELLIGVPVDGTTTTGQVRESVMDEINSADFGLPDTITDDMLEKALDDELPASTHASAFDDSLETEDDPDGEGPQAWFLLTWSEG